MTKKFEMGSEFICRDKSELNGIDTLFQFKSSASELISTSCTELSRKMYGGGKHYSVLNTLERILKCKFKIKQNIQVQKTVSFPN